MMIRTKLKLLAASGLTAMLVACLTSWWGYQILQTEKQRNREIRALQADTVNLHIITLDLLHETHARLQPSQWQIIYENLGRKIAGLQYADQLTYPFLQDEHTKIGHQFNTFLQAHKACPKDFASQGRSGSCHTLLNRLRTQVRLALQDLLVAPTRLKRE